MLLVPFPVRALLLSFSVFTGISSGYIKPKCTVHWTGENWQFESMMPFPETGSILIPGNYFGSAVSVFQAAMLPKILISQGQKILLKKLKLNQKCVEINRWMWNSKHRKVEMYLLHLCLVFVLLVQISAVPLQIQY